MKTYRFNFYLIIVFFIQFKKFKFLEKNSIHDFFFNKSESVKFIPLNYSLWTENYVQITALVDKTVTFTCSIELDGIQFLKSENYKIIWSREDQNGKDYEPLGLDDIRLISDDRISFERTYVTTQTHDKIKWNLIINHLKQSDSRNYICQVNKSPFDTYWLQKFNLNVNEPAFFVEEFDSGQLKLLSDYENSLFLKSVIEHQDIKLKCNAKGKPTPTISWYLKFFNGTKLMLNEQKSELVIKNVRKSLKINLVECQAGNGYGAKAIRSFKINLKYSPKIISKSKNFQVSPKIKEFQLNCLVVSNPLPTIFWLFKKVNNSRNKKIEKETVNNKTNSEWKNLNLEASFSIKYSSSFERNSSKKLSLSKYDIIHKHLKSNFIVSSILIKSVSEFDFGSYKCIASNEVANSSVIFTIKRMNHHVVNMDMRSLSLNKYVTTTKFYRMNFKTSNKNINDTEFNKSKKINSCSINWLKHEDKYSLHFFVLLSHVFIFNKY